MPNWCANKLTVEVDSVDGVNPLLVFLGGKGLTFNKIVPCPEIVKRTSESSERNKQTQEMIRGFYYSPEGKEKQGSRLLRPAQVLYLIKTYGAADWYSWNIQHWGTKWDIEPVGPELSGSDAVFYFETAWGPPEQAARALSSMFGGCRVTLDYIEPGCDFGGRSVYYNGECGFEEQLTARESRDISEWHEDMYMPEDDDEDEEEEP
jgi:hypothetical protein